MKLNKKKLYSVLLCLVLLCTGCQETPQEVQERMQNYGENEQKSGTEITYCTVDELKATKVADVSAGLDNMVLPEDADFSKMEELAILDMAYEDHYAERLDELVKLFGINKSTIHVNNHGAGKTDLHESDDPAAGKYFAVEDSGFVSYISDLTYSYIKDEIEQVDTVERYEAGLDDLSGKTVAFKEGEVPVTDMIAAAEGWLGDKMPIDGCTYQVSEVWVRDLKLGDRLEKQLSLGVSLSYNGVKLNPYIIQFEGNLGNVALAQAGAVMNYEGRDKVTYFADINGKLKINAVQPVNEVVSLRSAIDLVNEKIAGFTELKIDRLFPVYALFPEYPTKKTKFATPGQKVVGRPVYAFLINLDSQDISDFGINRTPEHFICVDMVTGKITTDLDVDDEDKEGK